MAKKARPTIDIKRIPAGEEELEAVMADVFLWIFEHHPKSSSGRADTFVKGRLTEYNSDRNTKLEVRDDDSAA